MAKKKKLTYADLAEETEKREGIDDIIGVGEKYKQSTPTVPISSKSSTNRNALGSFISSFLPTAGLVDKAITEIKSNEDFTKKATEKGLDINSIKTPQDILNEASQNAMGAIFGGGMNDAIVNKIKSDPTIMSQAKAQGLNLSDLKTTKEHLDLFGADLDRSIEALGVGTKGTLSNAGKGTLLIARDMGGATALADKLTNEYRNKSDSELEEIAKKYNISTQTLKDYVSKAKTSYENINDFSANTFDKWANEANQRNLELQEETDNPFTKAVIGFMPNISQQAVNLGVSFINPALVPYVAGAQAKGSYFNEAKERGMTDEQANDYSSLMAGFEALTEKLTVKDMKAGIDKIGSVFKGGTKGLTKEAVKEATKEGTKEAFKSLFKGMAENAGQEAVTEIIQESVADAITGKELGQSLYDFANQKDNWEGIWSRVLKAGASGALTAGITGGVGMGVKSCISVNTKLQNGEQVSQEEMVQANKDAIEKSKTLPEEQQTEFNNQINKGAEEAIISEKNKIEAENEQNIEQPTEAAENARIGKNTEEQQITQQENENALKENVEPQNQEQTQENQVQEENVQENLTEEENLQKAQEKLAKRFGEETANKLANTLSQEELQNLTQNLSEELNTETQNGTITEEQQLVERYENNKQEAENEFRRLQEESRGMSEDESELYRRGSKKIDDNLRARLQRVLGGRVQSATSNVSNDSRVLTDSKTGNQFKVYDNVDGKTFHDVFEIARSYTENGELVDLHPIETNEDATGYNDTKNYLSEDGMSGYAITKDGDLISVFNANPEKRGWLRAIAPDIKKNAKTLDCYISPNQDLSKMYSKIFGFKIASQMDYNMEYDHDNIAQNHSEPQVAFMVNTDQDVQTQMFPKDDYDGAYNYQQSFVNNEQDTVRQVSPEQAPKTIPQRDISKQREKSDFQKDTIKEVQGNDTIADTVDKIVKIDPSKRTEKQNIFLSLVTKLVDRGAVFENIAKKAKNRNLEAMYDTMMYSESKGQYAIGNERTNKQGQKIKSLNNIIEQVGENETQFNDYMYNLLNIDRMSLSERGFGNNKAVFGDEVTAEMSRNKVKEIEKAHPEFKEYAKDVYAYLDRNLETLVDSGVISQDLVDTFKKMYPHYVPISRIENQGNAIAVPLDTRRTGINAPLKRAKGGSGDIQSLFETIQDRTMQTYRAADRNNFGLELRKTLQSLDMLNEAQEGSTVETILDSLAEQNEKEGVNLDGNNPTFTAFENGNKVTYEITPDMYNALKPRDPQGFMSKFDNSKASKAIRTISNFRRNLLTEYNPVFLFTNAIKDSQDVLYNSQHAVATYKNFPEAYKQIVQKGHYYQEYLENGGEQNSYFKDGQFEIRKQVPKAKKIAMMPINAISKMNNIVETAPRLAEYIASREQGRSIQESMLDASRVTTNFKAGGDVTKFLNRNGATFLNASVQGLAQNVRNIREANQKGIRGYATLLAKTVIAGTPALILNGLVWKDDEDYEELSDYVKDNYYIVGKVGDTFIRIPKGRVVGVVQDLVENVQNYMTSDKEIDGEKVAKDMFHTLGLAGQNLAPNNPLENNILSPIVNVATNKTWYGSDLVPKRLQNEKPQDQYDESTDAFSKWLGQTMGWSPIKINYLLDQYGGGISDILLPMSTPQAEENNLFADKFTVDATMKNGNPGKFFEMKDSLDKSSTASDEDQIKSKYANIVNSDLSELYKQKREIQMSDATDDYKKKAIKDVQNKINEISKNAIEAMENHKMTNASTTIDGQDYYGITSIGGYTFYKNDDGEWTRINKKDAEKNKNANLDDKVYAEYKSNIEGMKKESEKREELINGNYTKKEKEKLYDTYIGSDDATYQIMKNTGVDIDAYLDYKQQDFSSDKEDDGTVTGKTVSGSGKTKFYDYMDNANMTYEQKLLLTGMKYKLLPGERDTLANYIDTLPISASEKTDIYKKLKGATVYQNGEIYY